MEFVNGIFLSDLSERVAKYNVNLQEVLGESGILAVRLGSSGPCKNLPKDTEPETIFLGEKCEFADHEVLIFPITKKGRNQVSGSVTFGRALVSDMCFPSSKISKLHGWFSQDLRTKVWMVTDHCSTNGVWVNKAKISPGTAVNLQPNDRLRIGDAHALFLDCMHLEALLSLFESTQTNPV
jgi:hypothetical protein